MTQTTTDAAPPPAGDDPPVWLSELAKRVDMRARRLQADYVADRPKAVSTLARLRQAAGSHPGEDPAAWAEVLQIVGEVDDLGRDTDEPTPGEWAAHLALTLFALHQQSHRDRYMHWRGRSLGHAVRDLSNAQGGEAIDQAVFRRFQALATAATLAEAAHHARGLVKQFRSEQIPLDYGLLADHFLKLQDPRTAANVRLSWGRDFYRSRMSTDTPDADTPTQGDPA